MAFGSTELRRAGENVVGQGRRPLLAAVGAGELAVSQIRELPAFTQARVGRVQSALRERAAGLSPEAVRGLVNASLAHARSIYGGLSERGEQVSDRLIARVCGQPRLRRVLGGLAEVLDEAEDAIDNALRVPTSAPEANGNGNGGGSAGRVAARRSPTERVPASGAE